MIAKNLHYVSVFIFTVQLLERMAMMFYWPDDNQTIWRHVETLEQCDDLGQNLWNDGEVDAVVVEVENLLNRNNPETEITVLTGYVNQQARIKAELTTRNILNVNVSTIDAYQVFKSQK